MFFTKPLPSNEKRNKCIDTDWWEGFMKYAVEMGSGAMIYTKFHKNWFRHSKTNRRGDSQTSRQHNLISLLLFIFFQK
jgi:hypothetical protein